MTMIVTRMLVLTVKLQRMNYNNKLLRCRERVNRNSSKIWLSPSHNGVTWLKWLCASQPLPEDAPAYRQIGARKVTDGREPSRASPLSAPGLRSMVSFSFHIIIASSLLITRRLRPLFIYSSM